MKCYLIMTDTDSRPDKRECDVFFETEYAFCGDVPHEYGTTKSRRNKFTRLVPGDILVLHENNGPVKKTGCKKFVGLGEVQEYFDGIAHENQSKLFYIVPPWEDVIEYRIKVDWRIDLRKNPIDPKSLGLHISPMTFYEIKEGCNRIQEVWENYE